MDSIVQFIPLIYVFFKQVYKYICLEKKRKTTANYMIIFSTLLTTVFDDTNISVER